MRGGSLRFAGQHDLRPLMLSMSMSVIAKSKLSFVYHCLLLLHLPLFLCRTWSAPPACRPLRTPLLVAFPRALLRSASRASARGLSQASSRLPSKPHDADGLHTRAFLLFCTFSFSSAHFISSMRTVSLHRAEPSTSTAPATTLQQPLLSVLVGRLMFASASATQATRRPFALSAALFSGVAFLRSPFFFGSSCAFLLVAVVLRGAHRYTRGLVNALCLALVQQHRCPLNHRTPPARAFCCAADGSGRQHGVDGVVDPVHDVGRAEHVGDKVLEDDGGAHIARLLQRPVLLTEHRRLRPALRRESAAQRGGTCLARPRRGRWAFQGCAHMLGKRTTTRAWPHGA